MKYSQDLKRGWKKVENMEKIQHTKNKKKSFATVEKWKIYCF